MSEFSMYDGLGLAKLVKDKEITPTELVELSLKGIEKINPTLNAVWNVLAETAEREIQKGFPDGPFHGVPFLIKELVLHAANVPVNMGSRLGKGFTAPEDSELMKRFRQAGLVLVGTTTTPEFGYSFTTEAVFYDPTHNPWDPKRSTGGSSGGSAAAVAAGITPIAHANDGAGSIRVPAACNGLVGLKPTRGRVPVGPDYSEPVNGLGLEFALTKSVRDTAALLDAVSGPDIGCYAWAERPQRPFFEQLFDKPRKLKIAWRKDPLYDVPVSEECIHALKETVRLCEELGHELVEDSPKINVEEFLGATFTIWAAFVNETVKTVAELMDRVPSVDNLEQANWVTYLYGEKLKASDLLKALDVNNRVSRAVGQFFTKYDVLLSPTTPCPPWLLGELNSNAKGMDAKTWFTDMFRYGPFTCLFNTTGQPAISLPLGWSNAGLPIGMHFAGRYGDEATLLQLAKQLEEARPWRGRLPKIHVSKV
nr:amidase [Heliobacterium chlorum]